MFSPVLYGLQSEKKNKKLHEHLPHCSHIDFGLCCLGRGLEAKLYSHAVGGWGPRALLNWGPEADGCGQELKDTADQ